MKLSSTFAILDVKQGRRKLSDHFEGRNITPADKHIPVTITGFITGQHSRDDGESIEFEISVQKVEVQANGK